MEAIKHDGTTGKQTTAKGAAEVYLTLQALLDDVETAQVIVTRATTRPEPWRRTSKRSKKRKRRFF